MSEPLWDTHHKKDCIALDQGITEYSCLYGGYVNNRYGCGFTPECGMNNVCRNKECLEHFTRPEVFNSH